MASSSVPEEYVYVHSCDLESNVMIKICTLEGSLPRISAEEVLENMNLKYSGRYLENYPDLIIKVVIASEGKPLHVPVSTHYKHFTVRWEWNQWLKLPLKYSDLPPDALLCITIFDYQPPAEPGLSVFHPIGGTNIRLFGNNSGRLRKGQLDLRVWNNTKADMSEVDNKTPGKTMNNSDRRETLDRLTRLNKRYQDGQIQMVDWLDRLTFSEVERINQKEKERSSLLFLMVEFQNITYNRRTVDCVYFEKNGHLVNQLNVQSDIVRCPDFDLMHENLAEAKHHRLTRSQRTRQTDKELKPNAENRKKLDEIIQRPSTQDLSSEEKDYVWRYRYYLSSNKKALAKFVKCTNWTVKAESTQALNLISKWAPMDVEDALELLGPSFKHPAVRHYAVQRLKKAPDSDLQLYLLQLVQALKYEKISESWLKSDLEKSLEESMETSVPPNIVAVNQDKPLESPVSTAVVDGATPDDDNDDDDDGGLAGFLIERACKNSTIANYFFWYLNIESEDGSYGAVVQNDKSHMYSMVLDKFKFTLRTGSLEYSERLKFLERQHEFITKLVQLIKVVHRESGNRQKKIERLQTLLSSRDNEVKFNFVRFDPLELPLDPDIKVCSLLPEKATLFKSSLMPARLTFQTTTGDTYVTLFKHGDDLRQDQLILQIITLMDRILQQENLDLKLTPYSVLATSSKHGFVQYIKSFAIADILASDDTIQNFFRKYNPAENGPYGINPEVMDTYVKSCAGYCVITFILGVGDRHLDNLLITENGNLFHIDFGYILGRDPKVLPPPMKLSKEMIEAFGGMNSDFYQEFKKECYTAYLSLRRYSNLILNLFSLMVDANVPDIALEPDKTVKKVQEKFRLDLTDEEAVRYMQNVIDVSAQAVMPAIVDKMHKLAQVWRN